MKVFVVIDDAMGGNVFAGLHGSRPEAGAGKNVIEVYVVGPQPDPHYVYVAQTYDRTMDVHRFQGVYGAYESARHASGPNGSTLTIKL